MHTIALVPARGGSKGLPGKNLMAVGGRSLVARAIDVATACGGIDEVVVSSDDDAILAEADRCGATPLRRPAELATDEAPTSVVLEHVLDERPSAVRLVLLQPTSPLRDVEDVRACLEALEHAAAATTVALADHPIEWSFTLGEGHALAPRLGWDAVAARRQDTVPTYRLTGAVYAARIDHLRAGGALVGPETVGIVTPGERAVDIDGPTDLLVARVLADQAGSRGSMRAVVLFGGGGHGRAVGDVLERLGVRVVAVVDPGTPDALPSGARHLADDAAGITAALEVDGGVVALGDNHRRLDLVRRLQQSGAGVAPVVAATATVSPTASLGDGVVVLEHAHVGPYADVGPGAVVNTHGVVEHNCVVGAGAHVAPGAVLNGHVSIGEGTLFGAGAVALPTVTVGADARIGGGAVVTEDVPDGVTVVGVPGRERTRS